MPYRATPFVNEEYYHIFNRGVAKMQIFLDSFHYSHFVKTMLYYQIDGEKPRFSLFTPTTLQLNTDKKIVDIVCYCLMPNHFHFLLKQKRDGGISEFISKLTNSYTRYFNVKNKRIGPVFQGQFKAVYIETNEQLIHVSRYIHLNPLIGYVTKTLEAYRWSSYNEYLNTVIPTVCEKEIILNQFKSLHDYNQFILDQVDYAQRLELIKHQMLDFEE